MADNEPNDGKGGRVYRGPLLHNLSPAKERVMRKWIADELAKERK